MPKYEVKWQETRVFKCVAEVYAESPEAAVKRAQEYEADEEKGEWQEETESYTEDIHKGKAKEIPES